MANIIAFHLERGGLFMRDDRYDDGRLPDGPFNDPFLCCFDTIEEAERCAQEEERSTGAKYTLRVSLNDNLLR